MKTILLVLGLVSATAGADAPAPTGLALIQARYSGTWTVQDAAYDTEVSRAGTKQYELTRDCAITGAVLVCKFMAQGVLQGTQSFTWDAAAGVYHVQMDIGGHTQPNLTLTVKDRTWIFLEETVDRDSQPIKVRILRQYHSDTEVTVSGAYSRDGERWTTMDRGTEIRKP